MKGGGGNRDLCVCVCVCVCAGSNKEAPPLIVGICVDA